MRSLKLMGLTLMAMFALGAAGSAVASADDLTSEKSPVLLTGSKDAETADQFLTTAGTWTCSTPKYTATVTTPATAITLSPSYSGCAVFGLPVTISMNGCTYKLNLAGGISTTADLDIVCPAGQEMTITVASGVTDRCVIHVKPQSDVTGTVSLSNIGAGPTREVTVNAQLSGIDYTHTTGSGLGACTTGSATNGTWNFKAILTGEEDPSGNHVGVFLSNV